MRAVELSAPGAADVMSWGSAPDPEPRWGEVVIEVHATAVNRADILQRQGFYPPPKESSTILGLECSGTIVELGPGVQSMRVGDQVCALLTGGGYAELVAVPVGQVMPLPYGLDFIAGASLPEVAATSWSNLVNVADLQPDDDVLIHGGAGGVGTHAIQLATSLGARVCTTAGSAEKLELCASLGANTMVNYRDQDFVEVVKYATGGRGVDIVLDNMGAKYLQRNIELLAPDGRLVIIGMQGGVRGELNIASLLTKRGSIHATSLRGRLQDQKADICTNLTEIVWPMIESGRIKPIIDRVLPISEVAAAHQALEDGEVSGKIVLTVR